MAIALALSKLSLTVYMVASVIIVSTVILSFLRQEVSDTS